MSSVLNCNLKTNSYPSVHMTSFIKYLISFSITHLFFFIFIFFGLGIFTEIPEEISSFLYLDIAALCIVATLIQATAFAMITRFFEIEGIVFFMVALVIELLIANTLLYFFNNQQSSWGGLPVFLLMNACLTAALLISLMIREYNARLTY